MRSVLVVLLVCSAVTPAAAQLALPGATAPAPVGTVSRPPVAAQKRKPASPRAVAPASPVETALAGKTLALNGGKSQITFGPREKSIEITHLLLSGSKISNGRDECQVDVAGAPFAVSPLGKSEGITRFSVSVPDCAFEFSVLAGAILTKSADGLCRFQAADCRVPVAGLWGPQAGAIGPDQVKTIERERMGAEKSARAAYKGLVSSTKDRKVISGYASDQAGFSSYREERCRDYIGESRHGFCASRLTQGRALTLEAELVVAQAAKEARRKKRAR